MKILHAPLDLAGVGWSLTQALRYLGEEADLATIATSKLTNPGTVDLSFASDGIVSRQYKKWKFCSDQLPAYDVVHYHAGRSILDYGEGLFSLQDLKAARKRGQVTAMTYHGCEVRGLHPEACSKYCTDRVCENSEQKERIKRIAPLVDLFYVTTPDLLSAIPYARLMPQSVWGIDQVKPVYPAKDGTIRIVHAPSRRSAKGSDIIIHDCEKLVENGAPVELILVEDMPHHQALAQMTKADVVVDNIITGWYGVVSVEAAARGKVVIVNIEDEYVQRTQRDTPPFMRANPGSFYKVMQDLIGVKNSFPARGKENRDFVLSRHNAIDHARQLLADYMSTLEGEKA